jgi:F0F1-type ATP synthase epsilon subunit
MNKNKQLGLKILTPEEVVLERENLLAISVPLSDGSPIGVRPGHAPLLAETSQGSVAFRSEEDEQSIILLPGVVYIRDDTVTILTAGEAIETKAENLDQVNIEYERMMETLVKKIYPDHDD